MALTGKVVVVTGAARGMGERYVKAFLKEGCKVVALDVSWDGVQEFSQELASYEEAITLSGDISSDTDIDAVYQAAISRFGTVDVLINNASIRMRDVEPSTVINILDTNNDQWQRTFEVSLFGTIKVIRRFVRPMLEFKSGSIINIFSSSGIQGRPGNQPYGAVKAALNNMTQSLAGELKEHNIAVNSLMPGGTRSTGYDEQTKLQQELGRVRRQLPVRPDHTVPAALFLAQQDAASFTGESVDALKWNEANGFGGYDAWVSPDQAG
jgi:NAD(P)-dependent dehydrogenase (short-subunit alcohol dehydrogenase family)